MLIKKQKLCSMTNKLCSNELKYFILSIVPAYSSITDRCSHFVMVFPIIFDVDMKSFIFSLSPSRHDIYLKLFEIVSKKFSEGPQFKLILPLQIVTTLNFMSMRKLDFEHILALC